MPKLTDEQIIFSRQCCSCSSSNHICAECHLLLNGDCSSELERLTDDLISRLKAENERLSGELIVEKTRRKNAVKAYQELKAEVERLEKGQLKEAMTFNSNTINNAVNEAYKEFAERLCKDRVSNDPVVIAVKVELEEMVGEG